MKKIFLILFCIIIILGGYLLGHSYRIPLIIDTDMGIDDVRALLMLLNQDIADIKLMVTSDGCLLPKIGLRNLLGLVSELKVKNIPMAAGRQLSKKAPPWREFNEGLWNNQKSDESLLSLPLENARHKISEILSSQKSPCIYLCLGPLTNLADVLKDNPNLAQKISRIIYYGNFLDKKKKSWNTQRDWPAAKRVFQSGIPIYILENDNLSEIFLDQILIDQISTLSTLAAGFFKKIHSSLRVKKLIGENHFGIWDELCVIYLSYPGLFSFKSDGKSHFTIGAFRKKEVMECYVELYKNASDFHLKKREVVVLKEFPGTAGMFKSDLHNYVQEIINTHGFEEWKACVLTNELHRHLGIYSIIGAKMGILARELLDASIDDITVISYAGNNPPLSCLNDGLQVSTGASLGRGTIQVKDNSIPKLMAEFNIKGQKVILTLKKKWIRMIKMDILKAIHQHGNLSEEYFSEIRRLSIQYWYELSRYDIFEKVKQE